MPALLSRSSCAAQASLIHTVGFLPIQYVIRGVSYFFDSSSKYIQGLLSGSWNVLPTMGYGKGPGGFWTSACLDMILFQVALPSSTSYTTSRQNPQLRRVLQSQRQLLRYLHRQTSRCHVADSAPAVLRRAVQSPFCFGYRPLDGRSEEKVPNFFDYRSTPDLHDAWNSATQPIGDILPPSLQTCQYRMISGIALYSRLHANVARLLECNPTSRGWGREAGKSCS
jgi:hypothetical protein